MGILKLFDKIELKTGEVAYVVEVLSAPDKPLKYICDIERASGTDTDFVSPDEIARLL